MKNYTIYIFIFIAVTTYNCSNSNSSEKVSEIETKKPSQEELNEGLKLAENNCFSCHSPNASMENRLAPPMIAVKKHYIDENISFEDFKTEFMSFIDSPSEEKSKMPGAVRRFDLMPKMNFKSEDISKIAAYLYYSEIEKPEWFEKHHQEEKRKYKHTIDGELSFLQKGQKIAMNTKKVLSKNLIQAINSTGTEEALSFCSTRAVPITDSMSIALNAKVKRVSDKNRNKKNNANQTELAYINKAKLSLEKGLKPKPQLIKLGNKKIGYYPILTNQMCLQCHGQKNSEISINTLSKINKLYPKDLAVGYKVNELRGIWVVEMDK